MKRAPGVAEPAPAKKVKGEAAHPEGAAAVKTNEEGEQYVELSEKRRVTVRHYKGKVLIDLREFYEDKATGAMKPGKRGIALSPEQWAVLRGAFDDIDTAVSAL